MISINTNLSSLIAQNSLNTSTNKLNETIERMSSGYKINHAKDNAANYSISTNMSTKISAYDVAADNVAMGMDMLTTATESLGQIENKLTRLRALATQAQNGTYGGQSLSAIQAEADSITKEIERLYSTAEYNGINLFEPKSVFPQKDLSSLERVSKADSLEANKSYRIDDYEDLIALQNFIKDGGDTANMIFELSSDIDMKAKDFEGIGNASNPFKGTFNGNGHVIKNLEIDMINSYTGFFRSTLNATIDSLGILDCDIISNCDRIAGLIGSATKTTITNCYVTGSIKSAGSCVSGLVGYVDNTSIDRCYTNCLVSTESYGAGGLVGITRNNTVLTNSYSEGTIYSKTNDAGGIAGHANLVTISNCYSTADIKSEGFRIGGLVGWAQGATIKKSYSTGDVEGVFEDTRVGGLVGQANENSIIEDCYTTSFVSGNRSTGAFLGIDYDNTTTGSGNYYSNNQVGLAGIGKGAFSKVEAKTESEIKELCSNEKMGFVEANGWKEKAGVLHLTWEAIANLKSMNLQVGVNAGESSNIQFEVGFIMDGFDNLLSYGIQDKSTIEAIDKLLNNLSEKSTQYGAAQNRLESAMDEIITQHDNLVSSRSTLRDADMAKLSSTYIQQQILQEASATLMATANQMPAIALQLI